MAMLLLASTALAGWLTPPDLDVALVAAELPRATPSGAGWEDGDPPARATRATGELLGALTGGAGRALVDALVAEAEASFAAPDPRGTMEVLGAAPPVSVTVPERPDTVSPRWDPAPVVRLSPRRAAAVLVTLWDDDLDDDDLLGTARAEARALRRAARSEAPVQVTLVDLTGSAVGQVTLQVRRAPGPSAPGAEPPAGRAAGATPG